jgi:hypothetical protein
LPTTSRRRNVLIAEIVLGERRHAIADSDG